MTELFFAKILFFAENTFVKYATKILGKEKENMRSFIRLNHITAQKMKFSIKDFFSKCDQIRGFLQIWSHLLKKSIIKNFIFCSVY